MPSPFPGMNPYLEQDDAWEDFHQRFITHAADTLAPRVGDNYFVKIRVRSDLQELSLYERRLTGRAVVNGARESYLEIYHRRDHRVVTVIELLSPASKTPGMDHDAYVGKRRSLLVSLAHLVEIDLRRGGVRPQKFEMPACDYYALVGRYQDRPNVHVWPIGLRNCLPAIPIPLTPSDADVALDLQVLLHEVYNAADYGKYIYAEKPQPPLLPEDEVWARSLLPKAT